MIRNLFFAVVLLLFSIPGFAQGTGNRQQEEFQYWESVLDAYEDFANTRAQLRGNRKDAETLREKQLRIEALLRHPIGRMTVQQQRRFNDISARAGLPLTASAAQQEEEETAPAPIATPSGKRVPAAKPRPVISTKNEEAVQPAEVPIREHRVERVESHRPGIRTALTPLPVNGTIIPPSPGPVPETKIPWHRYILLRTGFSSQWIVGGMAGALHPSGIGLYASFQFHPSFTRLGETYLATDPDVIWTNGRSAIKGVAAHAGLLAGKGPVVFYLGAGYGRRTVYWQDSDNAWAQITTASFSGISVETGGIVPLGRRICLGLGLETLAFMTLSVTGSIGIHF